MVGQGIRDPRKEVKARAIYKLINLITIDKLFIIAVTPNRA